MVESASIRSDRVEISIVKQARIPFVVFFLERSGSSHLCSLLDSHPSICCGAEEFTTKRSPQVSPHDAPRYIHSRKLKLINPTEQQALDHLGKIFLRSEVASGFKLKYPIQFDRYPEIIESLRSMRDRLHIIHLGRKNVLRKYISKQVLVKHRESESDFRRSNSIPFEPVKVELSSMLPTLKRFQLQREQLLRLAEPFINKLDVEYEDFNTDQETLIRRLLEFLGVEADVQLTSRFQKKTPRSLRESVANFDEMWATIQGTEFEAMVD